MTKVQSIPAIKGKKNQIIKMATEIFDIFIFFFVFVVVFIFYFPSWVDYAS
jgi:hypothetical protein